MLTFENFMQSVIKDDTYVIEACPSGIKDIDISVHKLINGVIKSHNVTLSHYDNQYASSKMTFGQEKRFSSWLKSFLAKRPGSKIVLIGSFRYTKMLPLGSIVGHFPERPWMSEWSDPWADVEIL